MFIPRLLSGAVILLAYIIICLLGRDAIWAASLLIALFCLFEFYRCVKIEKKPVFFLGYIAVVAYYILIRTVRVSFPIMALMILTILLMTVYTLFFPKIRFLTYLFGIIGVLYLGLLSSGTFLSFTMNASYTWLILVTSWGTDTCAYCIGTRFGRKHPFPILSPKKSVEGCLGGFFSAIIISIILAVIFKENILQFIIIAIFAALFSEIGDLAASAIKRQYGIKDFGTLIPGHGGMLDRFDSVLFTGSIVYIFSIFFN